MIENIQHSAMLVALICWVGVILSPAADNVPLWIKAVALSTLATSLTVSIVIAFVRIWS